MVGWWLTGTAESADFGRAMLMPLIAPDLVDERCGDGLWSRDQLEQMNGRFVAAMELAFANGLESRAAAAATYSRNVMNAKQYTEAVIESAIESAWALLCNKKGDMLASEIVTFVRERVPNIEPARVRFGFEQRFRQRGVRW